LESLQRVLRGEVPVFVNASELKQIEGALTWAEKQNVKLVIVGGLDAWRVADRLKERKVPVVVTTMYGLPDRRDDEYDAGYTVAAKLFATGVSYCLATNGDLFANGQDRNLPYQAALAAAHGLPKEEALKAITLSPAQILGAGARLGSLEVGKDATLILTNGDPLEITTHVERAWIGGREIDLNNRQIKLYDKYRSKKR
jgi:imidazolonepropionase-like amidohydrolase